MNKKLTAILSVILILALCAAFTACGGDKDKKDDSKAKEAVTEKATEAPTEPPTEAPTEAPTEPPTEAMKGLPAITVGDSIDENGISFSFDGASIESDVIRDGMQLTAGDAYEMLVLDLSVENTGSDDLKIGKSDFAANSDAGSVTISFMNEMFGWEETLASGEGANIDAVCMVPKGWNQFDMSYTAADGTLYNFTLSSDDV